MNLRYSDEKVLYEAKVFIERKDTIVETAKFLGMPKSTLRHHLRERLPRLSHIMSFMADRIISIHRRNSK